MPSPCRGEPKTDEKSCVFKKIRIHVNGALTHHFSFAQGESFFPTGYGATFGAIFALIYRLRDIICLQSVIALNWSVD